MDKHDKPSILNYKKCYVCHVESAVDCSFTEMAHYAPETGNLMMVSKLACTRCRQEILHIRHYVEQNGLQFGRNSRIFEENIKAHIGAHPPIVREDDASIYQKYIDQEIKRSKLYHCRILPQNCLQLVYYSSFSVSHAERNERIKNTISHIMQIAPIPFGNLQDVAVLVHYFTCYMHEDHVIALIKLMHQKFLLEGSPIAPAELDSQLPVERIWRSLYDQTYISNIIVITGYLLADWSNFKTNFKSLQQSRHELKHEAVLNYETCREQKQPPNGKSKECSSCHQANRIQLLTEIARTKNYYTLILRSIIKQNSALREHTAQLEIKFQKQKQEFINKIIKLKDRIQSMEGSEKTPAVRVSRSLSMSLTPKVNNKKDLDAVSEKSQGTVRNNDMKYEDNGKTSETDKIKQSRKYDASLLQRMIVYLPQFDPSLLAEDANEELLAAALESGLKEMSQQIQKLQKKSRLLESESKRLLSILTRKQERFVPLIHEKDEMIERYENTIWRMQNNLPITDETLGPRIKAILIMVTQQIMETLNSDTQSVQSSINEAEESSPAKTAKKKKKKAVKSDDKECVLF